MKKHGIKQATVMLMVIVLLITTMTTTAIAATSTSERISFDKSTVGYQIYENKNLFLNDYQNGQATVVATQAASAQSVSISDLSISGSGETVIIELSIDGQLQTFVGTLYPIVGGGYYDDKLVLGDFTASSGYNVVSFRVEKKLQSSNLSVNSQAGNTLNLVLEKLSNGEVYNINLALTDSQFNMFHQTALSYYKTLDIEPNTDAYTDMIQKTMSLMQINKNWTSSGTNGTASPLAWATPFDYDSLSTENTGIGITNSTLTTFFSRMDSYGTTGYNYSSSSSMGKILNQLGWKVYHNAAASAPYYYVSYGVDNAGASRLVQIILCSYSTDYNDNTGCVEAHMEVRGSVLVEWDTSYDVGNCKVVYYAGGPELTDVYLCASELDGDNTIFTKSQLTFSFYSNKNPWAGFLISRIPKYGDLIVDIWDNLTVSNATVSDWGQGYEVTVAAQDAAGGLIKDICARSNTASLLVVGNNIHLDGTVKGTYYSHVLKFMFTAENII